MCGGLARRRKGRRDGSDQFRLELLRHSRGGPILAKKWPSDEKVVSMVRIHLDVSGL